MARKIYYTSKGQPYIKLPSGRAKFIPKRAAGMSGVADVSDVGRLKKRKSDDTTKTVRIKLADLGKLVKSTGKCISIITGKGTKSFCPSHITTPKRKKARRK